MKKWIIVIAVIFNYFGNASFLYHLLYTFEIISAKINPWSYQSSQFQSNLIKTNQTNKTTHWVPKPEPAHWPTSPTRSYPSRKTSETSRGSSRLKLTYLSTRKRRYLWDLRCAWAWRGGAYWSRHFRLARRLCRCDCILYPALWNYLEKVMFRTKMMQETTECTVQNISI